MGVFTAPCAREPCSHCTHERSPHGGRLGADSRNEMDHRYRPSRVRGNHCILRQNPSWIPSSCLDAAGSTPTKKEQKFGGTAKSAAVALEAATVATIAAAVAAPLGRCVRPSRAAGCAHACTRVWYPPAGFASDGGCIRPATRAGDIPRDLETALARAALPTRAL